MKEWEDSKGGNVPSETEKEYWGIEDDHIIDLGITEEDAQFLLKCFTEPQKHEAWCNYIEDGEQGVDDPEEMNELQGKALAGNMIRKQQELLDRTLFGLLGVIPETKQRARHLKMRFQPNSCIRWFTWRKIPIICATKPLSYVRNSRYFLRWYWRRTEECEKRMRKRLGDKYGEREFG